MKQPQLGKKISALRRTKGFTQTELAQKCNLSLRTIQRIEATEVTPRSYTLKLIFKNLGYDAYYSTEKKTFSRTKDVFRFKKNRTRKILILVAAISLVFFSILQLSSKNKKQFSEEVNETIIESQSNIKRWMNNKQVDSVLTLYSDNACILNSKCGKVKIRQILHEIIANDYEMIEYHTLSISVSERIAIEKYESTYRYKGKIRQQIGIMEWHLKKGKWLIANDMFRDK